MGFVYSLKDQDFKKGRKKRSHSCLTVVKELWANIQPRYLFNELLKAQKTQQYLMPFILLIENEQAVAVLHIVDMAFWPCQLQCFP